MQQRIVRVDEMEAGNTDDDAAHHFAQDSRLPDSFGQLTEEFRRGEDGEQREEQFSNCHEPPPESRPKGDTKCRAKA